MNRAVAVTVDNKCRITIPSEARAALGVQPGDVLFVERTEEGILRLAKAINPFDELARHAVEEYRTGRTRNLREFASEEGINLDDR